MNDTQGQDGVLPLAAPLAGPRRPLRLPLTLDDGYETTVYVHRRKGFSPRLPVLYVHGIQSHPGWFSGSAAYLADRGHPVYQVVRRGSGDNARDRGHARSEAQLLGDLATARRLVAEQTGAVRLHLLGVSWGGKLAAAYAARAEAPREIASLTLIAPGVCSRVDATTRMKLAVAACLLLGPRRRFAIPLSEVELFTDNEDKRAYLRGDPFRLHRATARFLYVSRQLDRLLRLAPAGCLAMPTTLLLAERDRIIDNAGAEALLRRLAGDGLAVRTFPAAHVLEFERDPGPFHQALAESLALAEAGGQFPAGRA